MLAQALEVIHECCAILLRHDDHHADALVEDAEHLVLVHASLLLQVAEQRGNLPRSTVDSGGRVDMGPGTLYGAIKRLVGRAWISEVAAPSDGAADERRRYYTLTSAGRDAARAEAERMTELLGIGRAKGLELAGGAGGVAEA